MTQKKLTARIYTADRVKSTNKQLYLNIDSIREAIDSGKKVQFQYYDYSPDKQRILRHDGEIYVNSPYTSPGDDAAEKRKKEIRKGSAERKASDKRSSMKKRLLERQRQVAQQSPPKESKPKHEVREL